MEFELSPTSAEVETNVDPVDLANGEPTEQGNPPVECSICGSDITREDGNHACIAKAETQEALPTVDPELLRKWKQDCNEATKQHEITIEQTKALMVELDKQISYKTDELKSIKDEKKGAVERLIRLESKGPEFPPKPQPKPATVASQAGSESAEGQSNPSTAEVREPNTDDSWRKIPSSQILLGIERLGAKKIEAIVEAFPKLGDLEDARGEASKACKHFSEVLPDGIGKTIADKIEERMMDEIAKFSVGLKVVSPPTDVEEQLEEAIEKADEIIDGVDLQLGHDVEYEDVDDDPEVDCLVLNDLDDL